MTACGVDERFAVAVAATATEMWNETMKYGIVEFIIFNLILLPLYWRKISIRQK